jgi:hypothetical protein
MFPPASSTIQITAPDLPELFERALAHRFGANEAAGDDHYLAGFAAVGADLTLALAATLAEVGAIAAEHDAGIVRCEVSGVMATDEGQRAWGFVALDPDASGPAPADVTVGVERVDGGWRAEVTVATTEAPA